MISYEQVKDIVGLLTAEGVHPSRRRVRAALGGIGSYQTIGKLTTQALSELGMSPLPTGEGDGDDEDDGDGLETAYTPPGPDAELVARHLTHLRGETSFLAALEHLGQLIASYRSLDVVMPAARDWLYRQADPTTGEVSDDGVRYFHFHRAAELLIASATMLHTDLTRRVTMATSTRGEG